MEFNISHESGGPDRKIREASGFWTFVQRGGLDSGSFGRALREAYCCDEFMSGFEDAAKKITPEVQEGNIAKAFPGFLKMGPITLNTSMLEDGQTPLYEGRLDFSF